jgi:hypothetical protein
MARVKKDYSSWQPWGAFEDPNSVRQISKRVVAAVIQRFTITGELEISRLEDLVSSVAWSYLSTQRELAAPPPSWYREHITPLLNATDALLKVIRKPVKGSGRAFLKWRTERSMNRRLTGGTGDRESIEEILEQFRSVCTQSLKDSRKGKRGAKREEHVEAAVRDVAQLWEQLFGTPVLMNLETGDHKSVKEFTSPGPLFCQLVLQGIDPDVSTSQIETALRKIGAKSIKDGSAPLGKSRKSRRKRGQPQSGDVIKESAQSGQDADDTPTG